MGGEAARTGAAAPWRYGGRVELVTIPFSHFNERARWALNYFGQSPPERRYLPMFHFWGVWRATRGRNGKVDKNSSRFSTPVLMTDDVCLADSGEILQWADATFGTDATTLYPAEHREEIQKFEREVHDRIGGHTRRIAYFYVFSSKTALHELARDNTGPWQTALFRMASPLARVAMKKRFKLDRNGLESSVSRVRDAFADFDDRLQDRRYLFGDRFTAADLTLAAIASPVLFPIPEYGAVIPRFDDLPEVHEMADSFRSTATGRHVLQMFAAHRKTSN